MVIWDALGGRQQTYLILGSFSHKKQKTSAPGGQAENCTARQSQAKVSDYKERVRKLYSHHSLTLEKTHVPLGESPTHTQNPALK